MAREYGLRLKCKVEELGKGECNLLIDKQAIAKAAAVIVATREAVAGEGDQRAAHHGARARIDGARLGGMVAPEGEGVQIDLLAVE